MNAIERIKQIQRHVGANPDGVIGNETLTKFRTKYGVKTKAGVAHFFGNIHHESGGYTIVEENMNYSAARLLAVFPKYFTHSNVAQYANKPQAIANRTYGGRMGNVAADDGWKYRGRGLMQTTGKSSYIALGVHISVDLVNNPELVASHYALESAIFYFQKNGLFNIVSDISEESIRTIRRRVNGGYNGLEDTAKWVKYYYAKFK